MLSKVLVPLFFIFMLSFMVNFLAGCAPDEYQVNLTVDPEEAGEITGEGASRAGEEVMVKASPGEKYEFVK